MREELAKRLGTRGEFRATFHRKGARRNSYGTTVTALFLDVRDSAGVVVTDHLWFYWGQQMERLKLERGDRIRFIATVSRYTKRDRGTDFEMGWEEDELRRFVTDYRLIYPSNMMAIGRPARLPMFDVEEVK